MTDSNASQTAAPQPATPAAGQPGGQTTATVPDNQTPPTPQYDPNQVGQWKRQAEQYNGVRPLVDTLIQSGIKTPDELRSTLELVNQYRGVDEAARQRGFDANALRNLLSGPQQPAGQERAASGSLTADDVARVIEDRLTARDLREQHNSGVQAERAAFEKAVSDIAGADSPAEFRGVVERLLRATLDEAADPYPDGHPLAKTAFFRPVAADRVAEEAAKVRAMLDAIRGQQAVSRAQQAMQQATATGPGNLQTTGVPSQANTDFTQMSEQEQLAVVQAAMQGATRFATNQPMSA